MLGTDEARIAKSILFLADDQPLLVILCGNLTVDPQRLLAQLAPDMPRPVDHPLQGQAVVPTPRDPQDLQ